MRSVPTSTTVRLEELVEGRGERGEGRGERGEGSGGEYLWEEEIHFGGRPLEEQTDWDSNYRQLSKKNTLEKGKGKGKGKERRQQTRGRGHTSTLARDMAHVRQSASQAYIILISLFYLFLFVPLSSISFLTILYGFLSFFLSIPQKHHMAHNGQDANTSCL